MIKYCPYCDKPIEETDKYCNYCKKPLVSSIPRKDPPIDKSLHPYTYMQNDEVTYEYNDIIDDERIEQQIKEVNKKIEKGQDLGESIGNLLLIKASLYYQKRDLNTASKILEIALNSFKNENNLVNVAICHNELGLIQEDLGYFDNAIFQFDRAIELLKQINDTNRLLKVYNNIANIYFLIEDLENSYEFYQKAITLAREENLILEEVKSSSNLVDVLFLLNDYEFIGKILDRNAFIFNQTGNINGTINTLIKYGKLNFNLGEKFYDKAIKLLNEALDLIHKISTNLNPYNRARMMWEGQYLLGKIYLKLDDYKISENYFQQSLESLRTFELGDSIDQAAVLEELGNLFYLKMEYSKAIEYLDLSVEIYHKFGKDQKIGLIKDQIGQIIIDSNGDQLEAIRFFEESLEMFEKLNYEKKVADMLQKLGDVYINSGMIELAIDNFKRAKIVYQELKDDYNVNLIAEKIYSLEN
ncbi:MAG: tetratricopeptide repeat protein [Promethearchaeota archaeon]